MIELIICFITIVFVFLGCILLAYSFTQKDKINLQQKRKSKITFAIIIPARDESKVIEGLLKSIIQQSYKTNPKDVYIVVENLEDQTCNIAKKYNMNIVLRKNVTLARKGYAIDDAIKYIKSKNKRYDSYFIFDADNILDKDFIINMIDSYKEGYDITIGYRNTKNGNDSVVAASSSLTFSMINTMFNKFKKKNNLNVTISGTGFYISGEIIDKWNGYPFYTLTEDYELSIYSSLNGLNSTYNDSAIFYDEQPTKYKTTVIQRTRWIRGYLDARKKYIKEIKEKGNQSTLKKGSIKLEYIGIKPYLLMIIGISFMIIANIIILIVKIITNKSFTLNILTIITILVIVYLILSFITLIMIKKEKDYFGLSKKMKIKVILYNPLFLMGYIPCAIKALMNPNMAWKKIEHNKNI